jgi:hypothetical protein
MGTYDTPLASLPVTQRTRPAYPTPLSSDPTRRRTLGAIGTVQPRDHLGDRFSVLLAFASLPFLALAAAIRGRRSTRDHGADRDE